MIGILSRQGVEAIGRAISGRPQLAFDFDGTLAPLVDPPSAAGMRPSTRTLLRAIARAEDAFESSIVDVSVRVGRDLGSAARYFLESQDQIDTLLEVLLAGKARSS